VEQPSWNSRHGTAAMEWVPFGNRSAEAEYFFDQRNEEAGHYGQTLMRRLHISPTLEHFKALICVIISWIPCKKQHVQIDLSNRLTVESFSA
jgi:hypothetical protein